MSDIVLSHDQLERWAGQPLSETDIDRLRAAIEHSSIPEAIGTIVSGFEPAEPDEEPIVRDASVQRAMYDLGDSWTLADGVLTSAALRRHVDTRQLTREEFSRYWLQVERGVQHRPFELIAPDHDDLRVDAN